MKGVGDGSYDSYVRGTWKYTNTGDGSYGKGGNRPTLEEDKEVLSLESRKGIFRISEKNFLIRDLSSQSVVKKIRRQNLSPVRNRRHCTVL